MIPHPRLGLAVLGTFVLALALLAVLIARGGSAAGDEPDVQAGRSGVVGAAPVAPAPVQPEATRGIDPAWAARTGRATGIPVPAMVAYGAAQLAIAREHPGCHLSWNTLAGIGWVESQHGTLDDRTLGADGRSSSPVIGPALDGDGFAAIRSTPESATWHGDTTWEHAVGPLQFISSSWERWGADGDGDGAADPRDLDDAALAAGRYLCADSHDLATAAGWNRAVHSYNHDQAYVAQVLAAANTYAQRSAQKST